MAVMILPMTRPAASSCFIANLAPRKLKGIVSEGMILSAENFDGSLSVVTTMKEVKPGSEVK